MWRSNNRQAARESLDSFDRQAMPADRWQQNEPSIGVNAPRIIYAPKKPMLVSGKLLRSLCANAGIYIAGNFD